MALLVAAWAAPAAAQLECPPIVLLYDENDPRIPIGPRHSAYVKIAEGCNRPCAFCAIPGIRGRFQSRRLESVVARR